MYPRTFSPILQLYFHRSNNSNSTAMFKSVRRVKLAEGWERGGVESYGVDMVRKRQRLPEKSGRQKVRVRDSCCAVQQRCDARGRRGICYRSMEQFMPCERSTAQLPHRLHMVSHIKAANRYHPPPTPHLPSLSSTQKIMNDP